MNTPDWVAGLSDHDLERRFGAPTLARGRAYATSGQVRDMRRAGPMLMASVEGSEVRPYQCSVVATAGPASLVATCTCPVRRDCKHAVALIIAARGLAGTTLPGRWVRVLAPLVPPVTARSGATRLALQVNRFGHEVSLRPLRLGQRGDWVKAGATWADVRSGDHFLPEHRDALLALLAARERQEYGWGHRIDALPLGEVHPEAWTALRAALGAGVVLLPGTVDGRTPLPEPTLIEGAFEPSLVVEDAEGDARLVPHLAWAQAQAPVPWDALLGRPAHGAALPHDGSLLLGPLTRPLDAAEQQLFTEPVPVRVPARDLALFGAMYAPALRRRLNVAVAPTLVIPEPTPPTLVCRVEWGDATATLRWSFRYAFGGDVHEVGLAASPSDPPVRDAVAEDALAETVPAGPWQVPGLRGAAGLRPAFLTGQALFAFTTDALAALESTPGIEVLLGGPAPHFREADEAPLVTLSVGEPGAGDWFNLAVDVSVDGESVPFGALFTALANGQDHLLLDSGTWFSLDRPELEQLRTLIAEARLLTDHDGEGLRLRPEHAGLWADLVALGVVAEQSQAWQESVGALLDVTELPDVDAPAGLHADLRPYQRTGHAWLSLLWRARLGGILADEMGLGKTLQALALAQSVVESGEAGGPLLVVAPTSVVGTWASEAARFTPDLTVATITGTAKRRLTALADAVAGADIVVTSYTLLRLEADAYAALPWSVVLLDEAQFVKNHASKAYHAVRRLPARMKVALTGTPLENNLMDLWSLLSITAPGLFPHPAAFTQEYRKPIEGGDAEVLARLHRRIRPLVLRRTKSAVATELPSKQEQVVPVALSPAHRRLYDRHLARERQKVLGLVGDLARHRVTILRSLTLLRQLALAPSLVDADYPASSAKIDTLIDMLAEVTAEGHRALVFSQFTGFLALVRSRLDAEGIAFEYLDGRTRDRPARIGAFRDGDAPVFLISLKAGGFGLTLTEADYVFILDPWWNPAAEAQAIDRTHRIGQDKPVNVYRLVSADTIEEKVLAMAEGKRRLFDDVVGATADRVAPLSADDIRGLLEA